MPSGWPDIKPPPFEIVQGNKTITFIDMVTEMKTDIIVIPFIAIVANIGIAKAFGKFSCKILSITFFVTTKLYSFGCSIKDGDLF